MPTRLLKLALLLAAGAGCLAQPDQANPPSTTPAIKRPEAAGAQPSAKEAPSSPEQLSDAERIARLQRAVEDTQEQLTQFRARLTDPESEYAKAEAEFSSLDRDYEARKKDLQKLIDEGRTQELKAGEEAIKDVETKRSLAKERFDLAIKERKALQEQITTLEKRLEQDQAAIKKLRGEAEPAVASQPAAAPTPSSAPAAPPPTAEPAAPAGAPDGTASSPAAPLPSAEPNTVPVAAPAPAAAPPSKELQQARKEASEKQAEAEQAQQEAQTGAQRLQSLHDSIAIETKLLETARQQAENARQTEQALSEEFERRWQEGATRADVKDLRQKIAEARRRLHETEVETQQRMDRIDQLRSELADAQTEQIAALEASERKQQEAETAARKVRSLENPLAWHNVAQWLLNRGPGLLGIVVSMWAILWLTRLLEARTVRLIAARGERGALSDRENRAKTLVGVFHSAMRVIVIPGGALMVLAHAGVNIIPLMGGAAVVGLAVAFGAQNLVRDYFYGFMILLENQYTINDVVKIGDVSGLVERITLRVTVLRGLDGTVHFVPNGEISRVSNLTHGWSRALFDVPVAYKEDVDRVMDELLELGKELRRDPEFRGMILESPEMLGVDEFADSAVMIRFFIKTKPLMQWTVKRELLRRIKRRFDELGIEIPFPHRTLYHRYEGGASAPERARPAGPDHGEDPS